MRGMARDPRKREFRDPVSSWSNWKRLPVPRAVKDKLCMAQGKVFQVLGSGSLTETRRVSCGPRGSDQS